MLRTIIIRAPWIGIVVPFVVLAARAGTAPDLPERNVVVLVSCGSCNTSFTEATGAVPNLLSPPRVRRRSLAPHNCCLPARNANAHYLATAGDRPLQESPVSPRFSSGDFHPGRAPPLA